MVVLSGNQFTTEEEVLYPPFYGSVNYKAAMQWERHQTLRKNGTTIKVSVQLFGCEVKKVSSFPQVDFQPDPSV